MGNSQKLTTLLIFLTVLFTLPIKSGANYVFKLSEMKHVGDHCVTYDEGGSYPCNTWFDEPTKSCRANRCSCEDNFLEVNFFGFLECLVPAGKPCIGNLLFTNLMSVEDFKIQISNFTELEQRRELAVYNVYLSHILKCREYGEGKTAKDMSCSSGLCGENDTCTKGINAIFLNKGNLATSTSNNTNKVVEVVIGIVCGTALVVGGFLAYYFYRRCVNPMTSGSDIGFSSL